VAIDLCELRVPVEAAIDAYRQDRVADNYWKAWLALVSFFRVAPEPELGEDELSPDHDEAHYELCYRFATACEHYGFDPDTEDGDDYLVNAAEQIVVHLDGTDYCAFNSLASAAEDAWQILSSGKDGEMDDGTFLTVDLCEGRIIVGDSAWKPALLKKTGKTGKMRNKPCPCGSGRKFKKCCLNK
jgi:hypothetical protein